MTTAGDLARCRERMDRLSRSGLDTNALRHEALADLRRVIGFDRYCWPVADPQTLLPLDGIADHDYGPGLPRALVLEYSGRDVAAKHEVAGRPAAVTSISAETRGDLAISRRWDEVMRPVGIGDVAVAACRDSYGTWGWLEAYRDRDDRPFADDDLGLLGYAARAFGSALRRRVMPVGSMAPVLMGPPGVMVLDHDLRLVSSTAGARAWLDAMPGAEMYAALDMLPAVFYAAASVALTPNDWSRAQALTPTVDGGWMTIQVAPLDGPHQGWVAVTLRTATTAETFDLASRAYAFSQRERELAVLVVDGLDTRAISRRLAISTYTVQDHLKSVFHKVGVHSRRELRSRLGGVPAR